MERARIAIVGGGLVGPTLALALKSVGLDAIVIDATADADRRADDFDGRAYAIALGSQRLLSAIGVWDQIAGNAQEIATIHVGEGSGPEPLLHFDPRDLSEGCFGWIVEDRYLRRALLDAISQTAIPCLSGASVTAVARGTSCAALTLSDGREIRAELAVAADGRRSSLATEAGIRRLGWSYAQTGLVNAIEHDRPHNGVAHQSFFPGGPFAVLPLTGGRSSLVWSEKRVAAERLTALSDAAFTSEIAHRIGGRLGEVRLIGKRWAYPLDLTLASAYAAPRLALVGDAAHGVHPIAGQGMNMGLRDVAALTEVLIDAARLGEDLGNLPVLDRYQRWRRFNATTLAFGMDGLNRLFSNNSAALSTLRRAGLRAVDGLDTLRRGFMREAIGAQGDAPKLLRGEAP